MSKSIYTLLLSIISWVCFAQTYVYEPFPKEGAIWSESYHAPYVESNPPIMPVTYYESFAVNGEDTVIGTNTYKKLYMFQGDTFNEEEAACIGGIREDENKRVWFYGDREIHLHKPLVTHEEILLYDFSLQVGDSVKAGTIQDSFETPLRVVQIDTVFFAGKLRKKFVIEPVESFPTFEWIEGIGSLEGLFYASYLNIPTKDIDQNELIAFLQDGEVLYQNERYDSPFPVANEVITPLKQAVSFTLRDGALQFDFAELPMTELRIYSLSGQLKGSYAVDGQMMYTVNTMQYTPGVYLYQAIDKNGKAYGGKFVIK